ncbi:MAG: hypothetical protein QXY18_07000 [Nitrososphaerota archaeon]
MLFINVVFPAPFGPRRNTISPLQTFIEMPSITIISSYPAETFIVFSISIKKHLFFS